MNINSFIMLAAALTAHAANESPQTFTYQGRLFNAAGTSPLTGTVDLTFGVYNPAGNCLLYEETQTGIDLSSSNGLFSVQIGSPTGDPKRTLGVDPGLTMAQIFDNLSTKAPHANCVAGYTPTPGHARALKVTVTQGAVTTQILPNRSISSVPQALVAETLQGIAPSGFIQVTGNVTQANMVTLVGGLGAGGDASSMHHHDNRYVPSGGGTFSGSVAMPSNGLTVGTTQLVVNNGKVGIGTSPTTAAQLQVLPSSTSVIGEIIKANAGQTANLTEWQNSSGTALTVIDADGKIVNSCSFAPGTAVNNVSTNINPSFTPSGSSPSFAALQINPTINGISTGKSASLAIASKVNTLTGGTQNLVDVGTTDSDYFSAGYTSLFNVKGDGKVGIGTANPGSFLTLNGPNISQTLVTVQRAGTTVFNVGARGALSVTGYSGISGGEDFAVLTPPASSTNVTAEKYVFKVGGTAFAITGGYPTQRFSSFAQPSVTAASALAIATEAVNLNVEGAPVASGSATIANSVGLRIASGTSVGSGTTNSYGLYVDAATGATNNYAAAFATGNVGIGTAAPTDTLTVNGNARIGQAPVANTTVNGAHTSVVTTINVASTSGYPPSGTLLINNELMTYTGTSGTSFTGVARGALGTTAVALSNGQTINAVLFGVQDTATTPKVLITSDGKFAVGTASPTALVHVKGDGVLTNTIQQWNTKGANMNLAEPGPAVAIDPYGAFRVGSNAGTPGFFYKHWLGGGIMLTMNSKSANFGGNGTLSDTAGVGSRIQLATTGNFYFSTAGSTAAGGLQTWTDRLTLLNSGEAGFGITVPLFRLHIKQTTDTSTGGIVLQRTGVNTQGWSHDINTSNELYWRYSADVSTTAVSFTNVLRMQSNGDAELFGLLTQSSDMRLKRNIASIPNALEKLTQLDGVTYYWKDSNHSSGEQIGLVAQEVEKVFPQAVSTNDQGWKSVAYQNLIAPIINAIKELYGKNTSLEEENKALRQKVDRLEERLNKLEATRR